MSNCTCEGCKGAKAESVTKEEKNFMEKMAEAVKKKIDFKSYMAVVRYSEGCDGEPMSITQIHKSGMSKGRALAACLFHGLVKEAAQTPAEFFDDALELERDIKLQYTDLAAQFVIVAIKDREKPIFLTNAPDPENLLITAVTGEVA